MSEAAKVKKILAVKKPRRQPIADKDRLSLGATVLNLYASGGRWTDGGLAKGMYLWYVGDSSTGKTGFSLGIAAEASVNSEFDDYHIYFDNAENGNFFDMERFFPLLAPRIEAPPAHPKNVKVKAGNSSKIEEFYYHLDAALNIGPCIYILDSMDCLEGEEDEEKFLEVLAAKGTAKEDKVSGSYGTAVAKYNSKNIKRYLARLAETGSILIIINQTRDALKTSPFSFGPTKRPGQGGHALRFYAHLQLWSTNHGNLKRTVMGKEREYGMKVGIDIQKNRVSGWEGPLELTFLRDVGIDDVGTTVDYLVDEKYWPKPDKQPILAKEFNFKGNREQVVQMIRKRGGEAQLAETAKKVWNKIKEETVLPRDNRYAVKRT